MNKLKNPALVDFQKTQENYNRWSGLIFPDKSLLIAFLLLMLFGLVMVTSASIPRAGEHGWAFSYSFRQLIYMLFGTIVGIFVYSKPLRFWYNNSFKILLAGIFLLVIVLIPGIGREINGSMRWIHLGIANIQVSEFARVCVLIYAAAYLQRHKNQIHKSFPAMLKLLAVLALVAVLLLLEPDFGSTAVLGLTVLGMIFLSGVCLVRFTLCSIFTTAVATLVLISAPYRVARLSSFLDPWKDPFNQGYQLSQSLIAIGRGKTFGVGIGESIQKHHYLPEAHTDFIFSIVAEELGFIGAFLLILLFIFIVWRIFIIANNADRVRMRFASCLAYGIGLWVAIQALINMSVASGILPTKGLTLPMFSYGGSSVLASLILFALLLRIDSESRYLLSREVNLK